ncbi:MAG: tripartite tricarboxylate transporter substrate binding protein [Burkholderiales bacterium]|nr:tripartite tricarboxylate transporter substrate binding protein [Burkholderiales bacterium]ODU67699.1 MAG: ABC transporter substrate-binding protein [Lautropia sp. SCN 66-9]
MQGLGLLLVGSVAAALPGVAAAQEWPTKPIRFVVPYPPGGPLDQVARALAEKLREPLGQPVVVENRTGAGGNIGADLVAKSAPDGYSIVMGAVATHAINPYLFAKMPYDANRDFAPVTRVATVPNVLVLNPDTADRLGIRSVADLIRYARANPGKLNYASGGNGSAGHLAGELFKAQAGVSMVHIPYAGAAPAQLGLLSGQTDLMFDNLASAAPQIRAGKLKGFAVTTTERSNFFPELPTVADSGLKGFDISTWFGIFAPAGTPKPIVDRLYGEFAKVLATPDLRERLARLGADATPLPPDAFGRFVRAEQTKYERIVKASGARVD